MRSANSSAVTVRLRASSATTPVRPTLALATAFRTSGLLAMRSTRFQISSLSSRRSRARLTRCDASVSVTSRSAARSSAAFSSASARAMSLRPAASRLSRSASASPRAACPGGVRMPPRTAAAAGCVAARAAAVAPSTADAITRALRPAAPISALPAVGAGGGVVGSLELIARHSRRRGHKTAKPFLLPCQ